MLESDYVVFIDGEAMERNCDNRKEWLHTMWYSEGYLHIVQGLRKKLFDRKVTGHELIESIQEEIRKLEDELNLLLRSSPTEQKY